MTHYCPQCHKRLSADLSEPCPCTAPLLPNGAPAAQHRRREPRITPNWPNIAAYALFTASIVAFVAYIFETL